jgi:hypothetical protein
MGMGGPSVFISYRRQLSEMLALLVRKDLAEHSFDTYVDLENLDSGEFERTILSQIEAREHFIVLLQPGSLDQIGEAGDWLRREIAHALTHRRNVVPVTANGFEFRRDLVLPSDVARLPSFNAVPIQSGYFDAAMERLRTRFLKPSKSPAPHPIDQSDRHPIDEADLEFGLIWDEVLESFNVFLRYTLGMSVDVISTPRDSVSFDLGKLNDLLDNEEEYAAELTRSIFGSEEIKKFYRESVARTPPNVHVHFRIHIDGPDLYQSLRWELLRDPDVPTASIATSPQMIMSRYLLNTEWKLINDIPDRKLEALVVIAAPNNLDEFGSPGRNLADVDRREEESIASKALEKFSRRFLGGSRRASIKEITKELNAGCDILYIVAHGGQDRDIPYLLLEDENGAAHPVDALYFEELIRDLRDPPSVVFLNSCRSAGSGDGATTQDGGALAALGPRLARAGVPAVIAMQNNLTIRSAREFATAFFEEFAETSIVDAAVATARGRIRDRPDWWVPVLFSRLRSGRLRYPSGFLGEDDAAWDNLVAMVKADQLTPILGPGLADGLVENPQEIAQRWAKRWQMPLSAYAAQDFSQVSQWLKVNTAPNRVPSELRQYIQTELMERKQNAQDPDPFVHVDDSFFGTDQPPERAIVEAGRYARASEIDPHRVIAALPVKVFVTTGWTGLLQEALRARGKNPFTLTFPWSKKFSDWKSDSEHAEWAKSTSRKEPTVQEPLVYHLFGRLEEPQSLVLTQDDYFDWLTAWTASKDIPGIVPPRVKRACARNSLLFLGYYLDEWDFRVVFQSIKAFATQFRDNLHFGVQISPRGQIVEREAAERYLDYYLKEYNISVFWVSTGNFVAMLKQRLGLKP